jgi:serine protease inhibitor
MRSEKGSADQRIREHRTLTHVNIRTSVLALVSFLLVGCSGRSATAIVRAELPVDAWASSAKEAPANILEGLPDFHQAGQTFDYEFLKALKPDDNTNLVASPASARYALLLLLNGAKGETQSKLQEILGYKDLSLETVNASTRETLRQLHIQQSRPVAIANGVWVRTDSGPKPDYVQSIREYFAAEANGFTDTNAAMSEINDFVSSNTGGEIPVLLDRIDPQAVALLVNTVLFNGEWQTKFDPEKTRSSDFTLANGQTIQVPTMAKKLRAGFYEGERFSALKLPYKDGFSMLILLPQNGTAASLLTSLADVQKELDGKLTDEEVDVLLPKFPASIQTDLKPVLKALGAEFLFDSPDLSGMLDSPVSVTDALQRCVIRVDEDGTVAAAATVTEMAGSASPIFFADRPFAYVIQGHGVNLFAGLCADPRG